MKLRTLPASLYRVPTADLIETLKWRRGQVGEYTALYAEQQIARIEPELKRRRALGVVVSVELDAEKS